MPNGAELLERAQLLYEQNRYDRAVEELRRYLTLQPDSAHAHSLLACCLTELGQKAPNPADQGMSEAMRLARDGILLAPEQSFSHYAHAVVLLSEGHGERAEVAIRSAIGLEPENAEYRGILATLLVDSDRVEEGLQAAEAGLALEPNDLRCAGIRSVILLQQGQLEAALAATEYTLKIDPENAVAHSAKGWAHLMSGQPQQAIAEFHIALRTDPKLTWALEGQVQALKANTLYYRLVNSIPGWMLAVLAAVGWVGAHILPRVGKAFPTRIPVIITALIVYFLLSLTICISASILNLLVPLSHYLPKDSDSGKRGPWSLLEIAYLLSLAFLPLSIHYWYPGFLASLLADTLLVLVIVWEMGERKWTLTHGKIFATAFLLIVDVWLRG